MTDVIITAKEISDHISFFREVYNSLSKTRFAGLDTKNLCNVHDVPRDSLNKAIDLGYIERRGKTKGTEYRWKDAKGIPEPIEIRRIINHVIPKKEKDVKVDPVPPTIEVTSVKKKAQPSVKPEITFKPKAKKPTGTKEESKSEVIEKKVSYLWGFYSRTHIHTINETNKEQ